MPRSRAGATPGAPSGATTAATIELLARLAAGDIDALDALYRREAGPVYRYALALTGNAAWAADATQDAFVALAQRPRAFDPARGTLGGYLAGVARHALAARWREVRREVAWDDGEGGPGGERAEVGGEPGGPEPAAAGVSPEALLVRRQDEAALWAALRALPLVFREAVVLVDLQERPYAEAAQIARVELNTLRTRLHRGRRRLAELIDGAGRAKGVRDDT